LIIQNTHHVFDVHTIQDGVDIVCLQFVAVDDVVSHDDCVVMVLRKTRSNEQVRCSESAQSHTVTKLSDKEFSAIVEANEPLIVLLEDTLTSNTMLAENSIQARLGGVRLPTTVKKFDAFVINHGDQIAVEIYKRNILSHIVESDNLSVIEFEIFGLADSSIHESFDLTHEANSFDVCSMAADGGQWGEWWTLPRLSPQEGGRVAIVGNMVPVMTDLSITELLCQVQADQVGTVQI